MRPHRARAALLGLMLVGAACGQPDAVSGSAASTYAQLVAPPGPTSAPASPEATPGTSATSPGGRRTHKLTSTLDDLSRRYLGAHPGWAIVADVYDVSEWPPSSTRGIWIESSDGAQAVSVTISTTGSLLPGRATPFEFAGEQPIETNHPTVVGVEGLGYVMPSGQRMAVWRPALDTEINASATGLDSKEFDDELQLVATLGLPPRCLERTRPADDPHLAARPECAVGRRGDTVYDPDPKG